jgi:hypothetical protein
MYTLYVGDIGEYLAQAALATADDARLITKENLPSFLAQPTICGYTSLADMGSLENFHEICANAATLIYQPPQVWSDADKTLPADQHNQQYWTEHVLKFLSRHIPYYGPDINLQPDSALEFLKSVSTVASRRDTGPQLWVVGCSISHGVGVDQDQKYASLLESSFRRPVSMLTQPGSSVSWASDQICRADIQKDDTVLWGVTSWGRLTYAHAQQIHHVNTGRLPLLAQTVPEKIDSFAQEIDSVNCFYHSLLAIRRAEHYCVKLGAKLVMLGVLPDWHNSHALLDTTRFRQLIYWPAMYVDRGTDQQHPGPLQHKLFAEEFTKFYFELYGE